MTTPAAPATEPPSPETVGSYPGRLAAITKWAVAGLGAVGTAAVTKLSLDRLGKGDLDTWRIVGAYAGLAAFAVGVVVIVMSVVAHVRAGRATIGYLLSDGRIAKQVREFLDDNAYLYGGPPTLAQFRTQLTTLVQAARPLSAPQRRDLKRLLQAREAILATAAAERTYRVNKWAFVAVLAGALLLTLGAATFAITTNRDLVVREDRLAAEERARKQVVTGELLPKLPSNVLLTAPTSAGQELHAMLGADCDLSGVKAILLEIASPPQTSRPRSARNAEHSFHTVTEKTDKCSVADLWVPATWVISRPPEAAPASQAKASANQTATKDTVTDSTEPAAPAESP